MSDFATLSLFIEEDNLVDGVQQVLKEIRPSWSNNIKFKIFTDGITNKLVGCFHIHEEQEEVMLVRVYGNKTDLLIDRNSEKKNISMLHKYGFAPKLYATFKNGLVYEYVPGCTLTQATVIVPKIWKLIANQMAKMHKIDLNDCGINKSNEPMIYTKTIKFLNLLPEKFTDPIKHDRVKTQFPSIENLRNEFNNLYSILKDLQSPKVFCHNDLLLGNVIFTEQSNKVTFIDYEYADYNYQAFDIGNHFTEFAGIDVSDIDYSLYPSKEFQFEWLRAYLEEYKNCSAIKDEDVEILYKQVNQFALSSHFLWTIWGLIQAENSYIDYDFIAFAQTRYREYLAKKDLFLKL